MNIGYVKVKAQLGISSMISLFNRSHILEQNIDNTE